VNVSTTCPMSIRGRTMFCQYSMHQALKVESRKQGPAQHPLHSTDNDDHDSQGAEIHSTGNDEVGDVYPRILVTKSPSQQPLYTPGRHRVLLSPPIYVVQLPNPSCICPAEALHLSSLLSPLLNHVHLRPCLCSSTSRAVSLSPH